VSWPQRSWAAPDFSSVFFQLDIWGALKPSHLPAILAIALTDLFASIATFVGVARSTGLVDAQGQPLRMREALLVDAFATFFSGLFGTSSGTPYVESAAGIEVGARRGLSAIVTALCFVPCLFLSPLAAMIPAYATAPVLILVGGRLFWTLREAELRAPEEALPAFLTVAIIPLTFSITDGILWGILAHGIAFTLAGRRRELTPMMGFLCLLSLLLLYLEQR
jgi:AGZA family xanthine/uracil permease-like MFS transporter